MSVLLQRRITHINIGGRQTRLIVPADMSNDECLFILRNIRRLIIFSTFMHTCVARSYSNDLTDMMKRKGVYAFRSKRIVTDIQNELDRCIKSMTEDMRTDILRDYADQFYFNLQDELAAFREAITEEIKLYDTVDTELLSAAYVFQNLVAFSVYSFDDVVRTASDITHIGSDIASAFSHWVAKASLRKCDELIMVMGGEHLLSKCAKDSPERERASRAFNSIVKKMSDYDYIMQSMADALDCDGSEEAQCLRKMLL